MVARLSTFAGDVRAVLLNGLSTASAALVVVSDNVLTALGKLQAQSTINAQALQNVGRNKVLNGRFNIQQRGSGPWTTSGTYMADRWSTAVLNDSFSASMISLSDADRAAIGDEFATSAMQFVIAGTSNGFSQVYQNLENVRVLGNKVVTLSFYAKASAAGLSIGSYLFQSFGTGGSPSGGVYVAPASWTLTTSWARYSTTFTLASTAGKTLGTNNDHATGVYFGLSAYPQAALICGVPVQSGTFQLWGVQLEVGAALSPLEPRPLDIELALCQRFYQTYALLSVTGYVTGNTVIAQQILLPVAMRAAPTVSYSGQVYSNASAFATRSVRASDLVVQATGAGGIGGAFCSATAAAALSADI